MRVGRVVQLVVGVVFALIGLGLVVAGASLGWLHAFARDDDGYFTSSSERLASPTRAITSQDVDLGGSPDEGDWNPFEGELATVRFDVVGAGEAPLFLGVGPTDEVERYLDGVAHDVVVDGAFSPGAVEYEAVDGELVPEPPAEQDLWVATATGPGPQQLTWDVATGAWTVVVMRADGGAGVDVEAVVGVRLDWLLPLAAGLGFAGLALLLGGTLASVAAVRAGSGAPVPEPPSRVGAYPVRLDGRLDEPLNRWLWLVKWLLAIPHVLVLAVLWIGFVCTTIAAFFAILVTGRYPRPLFDYGVGVLRWTWRVAFYAFAAFGTDRYPPFTLERDPAYPADLVVEPPGQLSRGLVLVQWWLLALPHYLVVALLTGGFGVHLGGALTALVLVAGVVLLVSQAYPRPLFDVAMGANRWAYRVLAYAALMTDEYPPFRFDSGGADPGTPAEPTPEPELPFDTVTAPTQPADPLVGTPR